MTLARYAQTWGGAITARNGGGRQRERLVQGGWRVQDPSITFLNASASKQTQPIRLHMRQHTVERLNTEVGTRTSQGRVPVIRLGGRSAEIPLRLGEAVKRPDKYAEF